MFVQMFVQTLDPDPNPLSMGEAQTRDRDNRVSFRAVPRPHGSYRDLDLASLDNKLSRTGIF